MGEGRDYPNRVPKDEIPEKTVGNLPDELVEQLLADAKYCECPECGWRQWEQLIRGHNNHYECNNCGNQMTLVG